jgi:thiol-disulfide isomerase/thioredoxin
MSLRTLTSLFLLTTALSVACDAKSDDDDESEEPPVDSDGDGIYDQDEAALGTDPNSADSDDDGLSDSDEVEQGLDPLSNDTDDDGYQDAWELTEGSDPADPDSLIYAGGWPYNPNKDAMPESDSTRARPYELAPRFQLQDQYGEIVDLYDFAGQGKYVLLDLSGDWCGYCHELAKLLDGKNSYFDQYSRSYPWISSIPEAVEAGDIYWVTALDANSSGRAPTESTIEGWFNRYPHEKIPVLLDDEGIITDWMRPRGYPSIVLLDENMEVTSASSDYFSVLAAADAALAGE